MTTSLAKQYIDIKGFVGTLRVISDHVADDPDGRAAFIALCLDELAPRSETRGNNYADWLILMEDVMFVPLYVMNNFLVRCTVWDEETRGTMRESQDRAADEAEAAAAAADTARAVALAVAEAKADGAMAAALAAAQAAAAADGLAAEMVDDRDV